MLEDRLLTTLRTHPRVVAHLRETEQAVLRNQMTSTLAVERLLRAFGHCHTSHVAPLLPKYCATKDRIMALKEQGKEKF